MMAFKGTNSNMACIYGTGIYQYHMGEPIRETDAKAMRKGLHCTENPLEILKWYPLGQGNRYFRVEAAGDINERGGDDDSQLACTEMTLVEELDVKKLAGYAMLYICSHPGRKWKQNGRFLHVAEEEARGAGADSIAIARGRNPKVKGKPGSVLGLIRDVDESIEDAKLFVVEGDIKPDTWYTLEGRTPKEVPA